MNVKVNDLVKVRVTKVMDDRFLLRLWGSDNDNANDNLQYVMLGSDVTKDGDFRKYKSLVDNGVLRVKSIADGVVYLTKSSAFPKEIYLHEYLRELKCEKVGW